MNRISRFTITALIAVLLLTASFGFVCTTAQKKAVVDISLSHLCTDLQGKTGALGDAGAAICAYKANQTGDIYQQTTAALNAILARHTLSTLEREGIQIGMDVLKFFAPATFAEVDPNSADARAAKKEIEAKFKRLDKIANR